MGAGPGCGDGARGAGARGSRPVPPLPHPLSSLRWPRSRAPRLGLPERPRPIPTRPRAPLSARSAPLLLAAGRARRLLQRPRWRRRPERTWRQRRRWRDRQQQQQLRAPCVAALPHEPYEPSISPPSALPDPARGSSSRQPRQRPQLSSDSPSAFRASRSHSRNATRSLSPSCRHSHRHNPSSSSFCSSSRHSPCTDTLEVGMLLSKINSLAHLRTAPCNDLHSTKLAPGEQPPNPRMRVEVEPPKVGSGGSRAGPALSPLCFFTRQGEGAPGVAIPGGPATGQRRLRLGLLRHPCRRQLAGEWAPRRGEGARGRGRTGVLAQLKVRNGDSPGVISRWPSSTWRRTGFPTGESW